jgi:outer membrane lipoprotein-sorting protein
VKHLRTLSTRSLVVVIVAAALLVAGTTIAIASGGSGPVPAQKPLAQAIHDGLAAPEPEGITARITFTNRLFPSGALEGRVGSALMSGASGRLWARNDGRGRLELQSSAGDVQIVWSPTQVTIYDASSNTVYRSDLPAGKTDRQDNAAKGPLSLAKVEDFLAQLGKHATLSGAKPSNVAGREAYTVTASPKDAGGLLESVQVAWDAVHGVPLRAAIYARGSSKPVLALAATDITFGPVPASNVEIAPPAGAKTVKLPTPAKQENHKDKAEPKGAADTKELQAAGFPVTAPDSLLGLKRMAVHVVGGSGAKTALVVYGEGLGSIVVAEQKAGEKTAQLNGLPEVRLDGATGHELAMPLGTILEWQRGGVTFLLAGSVPAATADAAANALR